MRRSALRVLLLIPVAAVALAGCALPQRLDGEPTGPVALPDYMMQSGPQLGEYTAPARDSVIGCVSLTYDVLPDGTAQNVQITESHPAGYFDGEALNFMAAIRFTARKKLEHGARVFSYVPPNSNVSRTAAASLCSPVPTHDELNPKETP